MSGHRFQKTSNCAVLSLMIASFLLAGCTTVKKMLTHDDVVNARAIRAYLDMPQTVELNQKTVQEAASADFTTHMDEHQIYHYMQYHHIGTSQADSMVYYIPKNSNNEIVCMLSYNPEPHAVVTYRIVCTIGADKMVTGVTVEESMRSI